jgi:hypothetical protein
MRIRFEGESPRRCAGGKRRTECAVIVRTNPYGDSSLVDEAVKLVSDTASEDLGFGGEIGCNDLGRYGDTQFEAISLCASNGCGVPLLEVGEGLACAEPGAVASGVSSPARPRSGTLSRVGERVSLRGVIERREVLQASERGDELSRFGRVLKSFGGNHGASPKTSRC